MTHLPVEFDWFGECDIWFLQQHVCGNPPAATPSPYFVILSVFSLIICPPSLTWLFIYSLQTSISIAVPSKIPSHLIKQIVQYYNQL